MYDIELKQSSPISLIAKFWVLLLNKLRLDPHVYDTFRYEQIKFKNF